VGVLVGAGMMVRVLVLVVHFGRCHWSGWGSRCRNGEVNWRQYWRGGVSRSRTTDHAQTQIDAGQLR